MNPLLAASLFDNPWAFAVVLVVGALVNWLTRRAQDRQAAQAPKGDERTAVGGRPATEFDLQDALRRLMGEDLQAPVQSPPSMPDSTRRRIPPIGDFLEETAGAAVGQSRSEVHAPPHLAAWEGMPSTEVDAGGETATRRPDVATARRFKAREPGSGGRPVSPWRSPRHARQAWVASVVFGPPPSL